MRLYQQAKSLDLGECASQTCEMSLGKCLGWSTNVSCSSLFFPTILVLSAEFTNYTSSSEYQGVLMGKFQTLNKWSSFNIKNHYGLEEGQLCWSLVICWSSLDQEKRVNPFEFAIMKALAWVPNHPNSGSNVWTCQLQGYGCGNMMACLVCSKKHASNKL